VIAHKFLRADGTSPFTRFRWELPEQGPGGWVEEPADPCRSGVHACRPGDLPYWAGEALFEIELEGEVVESARKLVAPRGRLLKRLDTWEDGVRQAYQAMCAERAHLIASEGGPTLEKWDVMVDPFTAQGPGPAGFCAARIAEEVRGPDAFDAERAAQAAWVAERLGLEL
jgi:hypothetical protein